MFRKNVIRAAFVAIVAAGALITVTPAAIAQGVATGQVVPVSGEGEYYVYTNGSQQLVKLKIYLDGRVEYTLDGASFTGNVSGSASGSTATMEGTIATSTLSGVSQGDTLYIQIVDNGSGGGTTPDQVKVTAGAVNDNTYLERGNFIIL